jgi:regulator of protease activity HflC (stomatin/prohibitin superfamily)
MQEIHALGRRPLLVDAGTIVGIAITVVILGIVGLFVYRRISQIRNYRSTYGRRTTREGEPLEDPHAFGRSRAGFPKGFARMAIPIVIGFIVLITVLASSIKIVEAGHRGVLLQFGAVDTNVSLPEGLHFVTPFRDNVIPIEVRTLKTVESAASASKDLQDVRTDVALNYHINPNTAQIVYQQLGFDYSNRVINPAIQESVKQVTARFNAEELITNREIVKTEIEQQIKQRLAIYNLVVETISITEFKFSDQFTRAVEAKVEAEQRALQAQNELRRIEIEAQQAEAKAIGEQKANIAHAEGVRQANILQAEGEAEAIRIIDQRLRESPSYLEWLKTQRWDGRLPLVVGEGGTPFIQIPTAEEEREEQ